MKEQEIRQRVADASAFLSDFRREDGTFDTDYIKDAIDREEFDIAEFISIMDGIIDLVIS